MEQKNNRDSKKVCRRFTAVSLDTAMGHYDQAVSAFTRGNWAACNSQLRPYVEELFTKLAESLTGNSFATSNNARQALLNDPAKLFYPEVNEWVEGGKGYIQGFRNRLQLEGSHPGLSNESDSMFRLNIVQITTLEILRRYDNIQSNKE